MKQQYSTGQPRNVYIINLRSLILCVCKVASETTNLCIVGTKHFLLIKKRGSWTKLDSNQRNCRIERFYVSCLFIKLSASKAFFCRRWQYCRESVFSFSFWICWYRVDNVHLCIWNGTWYIYIYIIIYDILHVGNITENIILGIIYHWKFYKYYKSIALIIYRKMTETCSKHTYGVKVVWNMFLL